MSHKVETTGSQERDNNAVTEFNFECSPWKVKVTSKGLSPEDFGKMLKQAIGWRQSLFWLILFMIALGIGLVVFKPHLMELFAGSG